MFFSGEVIQKIQNTVGTLAPECGGIIAINQDSIISDFYFDTEAGFGKSSYIPSRLLLQDYIRAHWSSPQRLFCGIVHSHPLHSILKPSHMDIEMAVKIMALNDMNRFYLPIVMGREMKLYCITGDSDREQYSWKEQPIEIIK